MSNATNKARPLRVTEAVAAKFWPLVDKAPGQGPQGECWQWTGRKDARGYGALSANGVNWRAHRVSLELATGPIPDGLFACHKCDNPSCVNPAHLWAGSGLENARDMASKGRTHMQQRTHCANGHELTPDNLTNRKAFRECKTCKRGYFLNAQQRKNARVKGAKQNAKEVLTRFFSSEASTAATPAIQAGRILTALRDSGLIVDLESRPRIPSIDKLAAALTAQSLLEDEIKRNVARLDTIDGVIPFTEALGKGDATESTTELDWLVSEALRRAALLLVEDAQPTDEEEDMPIQGLSYCMGVDLEGLLINGKKSYKGLVSDDYDNVLSPRETRIWILDNLRKGHRVVPMGECDNWSYAKGRCMGHAETPATA